MNEKHYEDAREMYEEMSKHYHGKEVDMTEGSRYRDDQLDRAKFEAEEYMKPEYKDTDYDYVHGKKRIPRYSEEGLHENAYIDDDEKED